MVLRAAALAESSKKSTTPAYTAAGVVNSASNNADALAPNAIATIYGTDLFKAPTGFHPLTSSTPCFPKCWLVCGVTSATTRRALYYISTRQLNFIVPDLRRATWISSSPLKGPRGRT